MNPKVLKFIKQNRVSVLTTLRKDGGPHSAALHYAFDEKPLKFYFSTENISRKVQALLKGKATKASMVIGFSEEEWLTLQMDGIVKAVLKPKELANVHKVYYKLHPSSLKYKDDPATIFLEFTPTWWRYSDYNFSPPKTISS
ncbi:pyridoxamine 5'-phosphate oxidase family protein [Candidatus Woesebacteria bacterium]|nr:pyridoxamine 5'-phosphate oxidase family protein [Candidatus Woesebacteria bacterium]